MAEDREIVVRLFRDVWSGGNLSALSTLMHPDCLARSGGETTLVQGVDHYRKLVAGYLALYGAVDITLDAQIVEGDTVASRWTARQQSDPDDPGIMGMSFHRISDGLIVESWDTWDSLRALQAVGGDVLTQLTMATG